MKSLNIVLLASMLLIVSCRQEAPSEPQAVQTVVDTETTGRIDSVLRSFVEKGQVAGISALIYEKGREAYYNAFGFADRESATPMARNTIVQIYSMTKPITGVSLMTLYEQGAFKLDDPLSKYLPEYEQAMVYTGVDAQGNMLLEEPNRPISVRDVTRHTAGFPNRPDIPGLSEALSEANIYNREHSLADLSTRLAGVPLWFHPGEQWEYGPSVDVQARLVEKISGQRFQDYTRQHVLDPLGMSDTRYLVPEKDHARFAAMYRLDGDTLNRLADETAKIDYLQEWPLRRGGSGLTSTLDDYMRFARMLLNNGKLDGVSVLDSASVALMATNQLADSITERHFLPSKGQVGFGVDFAVRLRPPADKNEHYGEVGEFFWDGAASTLFWVDPKNELTAVLFVQLFPYDPVKLHKSFRDAVYGGLE